MRKFFFRSSVVLLSLILIFVSLPMAAIAASFIPLDKTDSVNALSQSNDIAPYELTSRRTANTKHFRLSDGSVYAVQYPVNIHYLDEMGAWQLIDNELQEVGTDIITKDKKIKFSKKITGSGELFALHDQNRKISFSLNGANKKTKAQIVDLSDIDRQGMTNLQKMTVLDNIYASVLYEDILQNTDLEYHIQGDTVKEFIQVKERGDEYVYSFELSLNNIDAKLENGEILLTDKKSGETVYIIPKPVMWDAIGTTSNLVDMSLTDLGNGKYTITLVADTTWINAEERALPITIDPALTIPSSSVLELSVDFWGEVDSVPGLCTSDRYRAYWKALQLPVLAENAYITDATFTLHASCDELVNNHIAVYEVISDWDETLSFNLIDLPENPQGVIDGYDDYQHICSFEDGGYYRFDNDTGIYTWNITSIINNWYSGANYGLALEPLWDMTMQGTTYFSSTSTSVFVVPQFTISYVEINGLEDYWTYLSQSAGFAGTGSVNLAKGDLVWQIPTLTSTDAILPYTPTLVYNSVAGGLDYQYPYVYTPYQTTYTPSGFKLNLQETLLKMQRNENGTSSYYYIWSDGDGTEHEFLPSGTNSYKDQDGLKLTLTENTTECTITDANKTVRRFSKMTPTPGGIISAWYLSSIKDKVGNELSFSHDDSKRPTAVRLKPNNINTPIEQLRIVYKNGVICAVWNPTSRDAVIFGYADTYDGAVTATATKYLREVVRVHGVSSQSMLTNYYTSSNTLLADAVARYDYDSAGKLIKVKNDLTGYAISYTYFGEKVTQINESAGKTTVTSGQTIGISYGATSTVVQTSGSDDAYDTDDDLKTFYSFDKQGRCISSYTTDYSGTKLYGASSGTYEDENENAKNSIKTSVSTTFQGSNYLLNGNFEAVTDSSVLPHWCRSFATRAAGGVGNGNYRAQLSLTSSITQSEITQDVMLEPNDYTLSAYFLSENLGSGSLAMRVLNFNGTPIATVDIPESSNLTEGTWVYNELHFTVSTCASYTVQIIANGSSTVNANVYVDNVMLTKHIGASEFDSVYMGHFENSKVADTWDDFWHVINSGDVSVVEDESVFGNVLKIDPVDSEVVTVAQTIYQVSDDIKNAYLNNESVTEIDHIYKISGWGKGGSTYGSNSVFQLEIEVDYLTYNTWGQTTTAEYYTFDFNKDTSDWQFISGGFVAKAYEKGLIEKIILRVKYQNASGTAYFDQITAVRESKGVYSYNYNSSGYIDSVINVETAKWYKYDSNNNLILQYDWWGNAVKYEYNSKNQLTKEIYCKYNYCSRDGVLGTTNTELYSVQYEYDWDEENDELGSGLLLSTSVKAPGQSKLLDYSSTAYNIDAGSHIYGTVKSETDARNLTTYYFYNSSNGRLMAVLYPEGDGVAYTYDAIGNIASVLPAEISSTNTSYTVSSAAERVDYAYDTSNRLSQISTESTTYSFAYDAFGKTLSIATGAGSLASYTYLANNGKIDTMTYANGKAIKYFYDDLDRVEKICYIIGEDSYSDICRYTYDSNGNVTVYEDFEVDQKTVYEYDKNGNVTHRYVYSGNEVLSDVKYGYDEQQRLTGMRWTYEYANAPQMSMAFHYDQVTGQITRTTYNGAIYGERLLTYDNVGRTTQITTSFRPGAGQSNIFYRTESFTYLESTTSKTGLISEYVSQVGANESDTTLDTSTYRYTYDANGNITQIKDANNVIQYQYAYDNLGQLIREDNRPLNKSYVYAYDNAGNRTSKITYAFTTGTLGSPTETVDYTYGNTNWGDLLTAYEGQIVKYDEIGNPICVYSEDEDGWQTGYMMTWSGRQLLDIWPFEGYAEDRLMSADTIGFEYNADGIRTYMVTPNATHYYTLDGSRILEEKVVDSDGVHYLVYIYDETGAPIGIKYSTDNTTFSHYFFEKNLQGDIIAIYNASGTKIGTYTYDAWGNVTVNYTMGVSDMDSWLVQNNPFRYRGYYYDVETGLYYLQTRYYNPEIGRFINADGYISTGTGLLGYNMFAYCNNNPVMFVDFTGELFGALITVAAIVIGGCILGEMARNNAIEIIETNNFVENCDVAPMDDEKYNELNPPDSPTYERPQTVGMSPEEKLAYVRKVREERPEIAKNWSEAEMLREFNYHDKWFYIAIKWGSDPYEKNSYANRLGHVDFEEKQTFKTYLYRFVGNGLFR